MKILLCAALLATAFPLAAAAQHLRLETDSLPLVQARARQQHKLVLAIVPPPPASASLPPALRKARSRSGLYEPEVARSLGTDVLVREVPFGSAEARQLGQQYGITTYPTYLYFGPDGALLHRRFGNAASPAPYLQDLATARQELANPRNLSYYETTYAQGNREAGFLHDYLAKRQQLGQAVEPALLDAYAEQLPARAFDRGADVLYILELGPTVGSRAFQLTHLNQPLIDSLYQVLPLARRMAINNQIIARTSRQAVATHDASLARQGANFARGTWGSNYQQAARTYDSNMLDFYRLTKDTTSYLRQASLYYERYYMSIAADSVKKVIAAAETRQQQELAARRRVAAAGGFRAGTTLMTTTVERSGSPAPAFVNELNTGAWSVYLTGTRNRDYLSRAVQWSKRTVDLAPRAAYYDTLAHLLYRLRFYAEAEAMQQQAVAHATADNLSPDELAQDLRKMKARQPL